MTQAEPEPPAAGRPPVVPLPAGPHGLLLDCTTPRLARELYAELDRRHRAGDLPGVVDVVPAERTVLLVVRDDDGTGADTLAHVRSNAAGLLAGTAEGRQDGRCGDAGPASGTDRPDAGPAHDVLTLPTHYDGPDLDEVGRLSGLGREGVVAAHTAAELTVAFCGFAPGFGYLTGLPEPLRVARRERPRTRVPAGSVALAGGYAGVYPRQSPGGWQLIGRVALPAERLWDPRRDPPALLAPGTRVRFADAGTTPEGACGDPRDGARPASPPVPDASASRATATATAGSLLVHRAGVLLTVQDRGRFGYGHLGVGRAGALDSEALELANRLVGNPATAAGLEVTLGGCVVEPDRDRYLAVTGARAPLWLDGRLVDENAPLWVPAGARLEIGPVTWGLRCYLAVAGGVVVPPVLGSRGFDVLGGIGPPAVRDGTRLPLGTPVGLPGPADAVTARHHGIEPGLRVMLGPRDDWFTPEALRRLRTGVYTVTADTDRIGARLEGPPLERRRDGELPSEGVVAGALQVPPDGRPVLFLADHPTTGGYPVIGCVDPADLPAVAQAAPGTRIRFRVR